MIEGRPRESLVQYENPIEVSNPNTKEEYSTIYFDLQISGGHDMDPFKKSFGKYFTFSFLGVILTFMFFRCQKATTAPNGHKAKQRGYS